MKVMSMIGYPVAESCQVVSRYIIKDECIVVSSLCPRINDVT